MTPLYTILCKLLQYHININSYRLQFINNYTDVPRELEDINLDDIILDLIGYPADNTAGFYKLHNDSRPHSRTDTENLFCRDDWYTIGYEATMQDVPSVIKRFCKDYYALRIRRPHLFEVGGVVQKL